MRFTISSFLLLAAILVACGQAAPAAAPERAQSLDKKALAKQRIAAAQYQPNKRSQLEARQRGGGFGNNNNNNNGNNGNQTPTPTPTPTPQPSGAAVCTAPAFGSCNSCNNCPDGYTCRTMPGYNPSRNKLCYYGYTNFKRRADGTLEEVEPEQDYFL